MDDVAIAVEPVDYPQLMRGDVEGRALEPSGEPVLDHLGERREPFAGDGRDGDRRAFLRVGAFREQALAVGRVDQVDLVPDLDNMGMIRSIDAKVAEDTLDIVGLRG